MSNIEKFWRKSKCIQCKIGDPDSISSEFFCSTKCAEDFFREQMILFKQILEDTLNESIEELNNAKSE